jgi:large repetitive protein
LLTLDLVGSSFFSVVKGVRRGLPRVALGLGVMAVAPMMAWSQATTTTSLGITGGGSVGTVETLTATVTTGGSTVTAAGTVVFCDDTTYVANQGICGVKAQLGTEQITAAGSAVLKVRLGPGTHSLYAKFVGTPGAATPLAASSSFVAGSGSGATNANYTVTATAAAYPLPSVLAATGTPGDYVFTDTLVSATAGSAPTSAIATLTDTTVDQTIATLTFGAVGSSISISPATVVQPAYTGVATGSKAIVKGDFNNDGYLDLVDFGQVSSGTPAYSLLLGSSTNPGTFTPGTPVSSSHSANYAVTGDFNNDGYLDIAYVSTSGVMVLLNNGAAGGFTIANSGNPIDAQTAINVIAVGDFNGDGNLDIAMSEATGGVTGFQIYTGNGAGGFTAGSSFTTVAPVEAMGAADLNGDGYTDLMVSTDNTTSGTVITTYYYQSSSTGFTSTATTTLSTTTTSSPRNLVLADLKNDGVLDALYAATSGLSVALNGGTTSAPSFSTITNTTFTGETSNTGLTVGDVNNDGYLDAIAGGSSGTIAVFAGTGAGGFGTPVYYATQSVNATADGIVTGDFTGSGLMDVATANTNASVPVSLFFSGFLTAGSNTTGLAVNSYGAQNVSAVTASSNYTATTMSNTLSVTGGSIALTASPANSSTLGTTVNLSATIASSTISAEGGAAPTGSLAFYDGSTLLGSGTISSGSATYAVVSPPVGSHLYSAKYIGDSNYTAYSSALPLTSNTAIYVVTGAGVTPTQLVFGNLPNGSETTTSTPPAGNTIAAGASAGIVTVVEESASGAMNTASTDAIQLVVTSNLGYSATYTTGTTAGTVTPTLANGVATFDLSSIPQYAVGGSAVYTYTVSAPGNGSVGTANAYVNVSTGGTGSVFMVTQFNDGTTGTCPNWNVATAPTNGGSCTLRGALVASQASASVSGSTIIFNYTGTPQTINLASNLSSTAIKYPTTIAGPGPGKVTVSGAAAATPTTPAYAIFKTSSPGPTLVTISGLTLEYATATNGPAIYVYGPVAINNMTFYGNTSGSASGGAVYVSSTGSGTLTVTNSTFQSNTAGATGGGGISDASSGVVSINNCYFLNNSATGNGGAVYINSATSATLTNSTFTGNSTTGYAGGFYMSTSSTTLSMANDTFFNNSAAGSDGGAVYMAGTTATLSYTTIVGNYLTGTGSGTGGGLYSSSTNHLTLQNSVIAGNKTAYTSGNADLYYSTSSGFFTNLGSLYQSPTSVNVDTLYPYPGTSALGLTPSPASYGSLLPPVFPIVAGTATQTQMPVLIPIPGSVLLKSTAIVSPGTTAPVPVSTINTDERGFPRPASGGTGVVDLGAVQSNLSLSYLTGTPSSTQVGVAFSPQPQVAVFESGQPVLAATPITMGMTSGTLNGTTTVSTSAVTGIATFSGLASGTPETGTALEATAGTYAVDSGPFNVTSTVTQVVYGTAPAATITAGGNAGTVTVVLENSSNAVVAADNTVVSLAVTGPNGYSAGYLEAASGGTATFNLTGWPLTVSGSYTYVATYSTGITVTATETVNVAPINHLTVSGPAKATAGFSATLTVTAVDAYGNTVTSFSNSNVVTVSSSTDSTATIGVPAALPNGVGTFTIAFDITGNQTATATAASGGYVGTSATIVTGNAIWLVNSNGSLVPVSEAGAGVSGGAVGMSGTTSTLGGVAFDNAGGVWSVSSQNNALDYVSAGGASSAVYTGGGLSAPTGVAVDGVGYLWVANSGNGSVSVFNNSGVAQSGAAGYGTAGVGAGPSAIAIDNTGGVWVASKTANSVTHILGAAQPVTTPTATATANGTIGAKP